SLLKTNTQPTLDELKLAHILNGETCPPIAFPDFAAFVTHKEFTTENLLFVIWFRSYKARFDELQDGIKASVPVPSTKLGDRHAPFGYLDKAIAQGHAGGSTGSIPKFEGPPQHLLEQRRGSAVASAHEFKPCSWTSEGKPGACENPSHNHSPSSRATRFSFRTKQQNREPLPQLRPILHHGSLHPPLPPLGTQLLESQDQPMRDEAQRAFATFLRKGGSREVGISDDLREFARITLARSTSPEVFLPVYEEIYQVIETQSLPHFLTYAKSNINRPKQLFWYTVGLIDFSIGVAIYLILTLLLSKGHFGYRAIRLPSILFTSFGAMQSYSAYRGFCTQVWGRASRQVRPWEMDEYEGDEEAALASDPDPEISRLSRSRSGDSEQIFTPMQDKEMDLGLPHEVHPLADLGGTTARGDIPWATTVPVLGAGIDDEEMSEVQRRQLAIRRATVKVPDASLAFPIGDIDSSSPPASTVEPTFPFVVIPPTPLPDSTAWQQPSDVIPFQLSEPLPVPETTHQDLRNLNQAVKREGEDGDLSTLLSKFRMRRQSETQHIEHGRRPVGHEGKVFGPETLVEDPRITELYNSVVRDILIVGGVTAVVWIALCLAVP
ncbi:hypothetical protein BCR39DRAFT_445113, partial [Naematelia encephala]